MLVGKLKSTQKTSNIIQPPISLHPLLGTKSLGLKLSTINFDPTEAKKKMPIVSVQKIKIGQLGNSKCKLSTVAQQLVSINAINAMKQKTLRNLFWFILLNVLVKKLILFLIKFS